MAAEKKGGKVKLKRTSQRYKNYVKDGAGVKKKNRECPKCGLGVFMAKHANRETCGKCGYTEFKSS